VAVVDLTSVDIPPRLVLAHELAHVFLQEGWSDAPEWWKEGVAVELSHSTAHVDVWAILDRLETEAEAISSAPKPLSPELQKRGRAVLLEIEAMKRGGGLGPAWDASVWDRCPARIVASWPEERLRTYLTKVEDFDKSPWSYLVAGTVVRFWIEKKRPASILHFEPQPVPDAGELAAWLRSVKDGQGLHDRFPPVDWPSLPR
jgi:hypothetical protein